MIKPFINLYRTLEEANSFENSQINRFYDFTGVQILPNNSNKIIQSTNVSEGINLEDWTVYVVQCDGTKTDITISFMVEQVFTDGNGKEQILWSLKNVAYDFYTELVYLEIHQSLGETFYSSPFLLTNNDSNKVTQIFYKTKVKESFQSISAKFWFRQNQKETELKQYYEISTSSTVTQSIKRKSIKKYITELIDIDTLIKLSDVLESKFMYLDSYRSYLYEAVKIPELTSQENFGTTMIHISQNTNDIIDYDALFYEEPSILPIAVNDTFTVAKTGVINLKVLANDNLGVPPTDITYIVQTGITTGTLSISIDKQSINFTPNGTIATGQTFVYTIDDSNGNMAQATVTLNVQNAVVPLTAVNDTVTLNNAGVQTISVLSNDSLGTLPTNITSVVTTSLTIGAVAITSGGQSLTFTPNGTIASGQTMTYTITDSTGATSTATITITTIQAPASATFSNGSSLGVSPYNGVEDIKSVSGTITITGGSFRIKSTASVYINNNTTISNQSTVNGISLYSERTNSSGINVSTSYVDLAPGTYNYNLYVRGSGTGGSGSGGFDLTQL
jgi:hypothetical protein